MSTNFYWAQAAPVPAGEESGWDPDDDPRNHIGKWTWGGAYKPGVFYWCQTPEAVAKVAGAHPRAKLIRDEYGKLYTWGQFQTVTVGLTPNLRSLGKHFC